MVTLKKLFHLRAIEVFSPQGEPASHSEILLFQPFIFFIDHSKTIVTVTRLKRWHKLIWEERVRKDRVQLQQSQLSALETNVQILA